MVRVDYYENARAKKNGEILGTFNIDIVPVEVPEVDEKLKKKTKTVTEADGTTREVNLYDEAVEKRAKKMDEAIKDCQFAALDKVREIVGVNGVLVATIIEEESDEQEV